MTEVVDKGVNAGALRRVFAQEDVNFLLTNRVPRIALTHLMGRVSRIRSPLFTRAAIALWRLFTDLDLREAKPQRFDSIHDCFTRELREGARPIDTRAEILTSPCDAIVGACGTVEHGQLFQAKGMPYAMADLFGPSQDSAAFEGATRAMRPKASTKASLITPTVSPRELARSAGPAKSTSAPSTAAIC